MDGDAPGAFDRSAWFTLLAEREAEPLLAAEQASAMVLARRNGRIESLTNWYSFIWRPSGSHDPAALEQIARSLRGCAPRVVLSPLPDEDDSATTCEAAFRAAGWIVEREPCDHNHVLPINGRSFAQYWEERPGRMRTTLKRKAKKVQVEILTRFDGDGWAAYEEIYRHSWKPEEGDPVLLRDFAMAEGVAGHLRLGIARHDGLPVAAQFWTVERGTAYIHKLAHLEEHKPLSAGTTLSAALFEHVIDRDGVELVDFGTGNDPYKRDWMEIDRPRYRLDCLDPRAPAAWPALAKRLARRVAHRNPRG